ncbi:DPP IV N-terminal domain-containing protein [Salipaludibacillus sp. CF4.18]|uniref:DPP IV N-terminal domain-containing protein n=1 Tax=Salipaludibacillus sp. CF4.18 TaxID=3373081 RepID=UPI003EE6839C
MINTRKPLILLLVFILVSTTFLLKNIVSGEKNETMDAGTATLTEGTNIAVTVSPDGENLIMDFQGVLWSLPISGGTATRITDNYLDPSLADWSPDGNRITFQSYKDGNYHIWTMKPDGTDLQQLTEGPFDHREPTYSPNGKKIAFSSDRGGSYDIWVLDLETHEISQWTNDTTEVYQPTWSPDGDEIAYINDAAFVSGNIIEAIDEDGAHRTLVEGGGSISSPSWSPDGTSMSYVLQGNNLMIADITEESIAPQTIDEGDVFPFRVEWISENEIIYTADGHIKQRNLGVENSETIPFEVEIEIPERDYEYKEHDFDSNAPRDVKGIVAPQLSPDGKQIAFVALNDLWIWDIDGGEPRPLTDDTYLEVSPSWSPDGKQLAYSSDKAGTLNIYILDLETNKERKLTSSTETAEMSPAWSSDGKQIAFQDQTGVISSVYVDSGEVEAVTGRLSYPGPPTWGPNNKIALSAIKTNSNRYREGTNQILVVDQETGSESYVDPIDFNSLSNRANSGPMWSPDGEYMAFIIESQLWIMPFNDDGESTGDPIKVSEDIAESPSWSGDSNTLLYLSNGDLKRVSIDGGEPETLDFQMQWTPKQPTETTVIHAGKLWDGNNENIQENVDIIIEGNRIKEIKDHEDTNHEGVEFIDASDLTVMPGLWDAHIHQEMERYTEGTGSRVGRQLLSFGITSTMSMGDIAYQAIEDRESLQSGASVGPRFFATGELIEGSRVYYNVMRPTASEEGLQRELERAEALDYDLIKTYVRLSNEDQDTVIKKAHELGVPTFSHYFFPSMAFGQDGTSHISATQRLGFSRTKSPSGHAYDDVIELSGKSGMSMTSALLGSARPLLAHYPELFSSDPRLETLYTPWKYQAYEKQFERASTDYSARLAQDVGILKDIMDAGGMILAGTDTPIDYTAVPLHLNLKAMNDYGMTPFEALQTATINPAQVMGVEDDLGTIEEGKLADLILVEGNPHEDIKDAANVQKVMKNGEVYTIDDIVAPFNEDIKQDISASDIKVLVEQFEEEGEFANNGAPRSLHAHLDIVERFETERNEKVVKHLESFKRLLDNQKNSAFISDNAYNILMANTDSAIEKFQ